jgi:hypothetical protein
MEEKWRISMATLNVKKLPDPPVPEASGQGAP